MNEILNNLFKAAAKHGADRDNLAVAVEDLQGLLLRSWSIMNVAQKFQLLRSQEVADLLQASLITELNPDALVQALNTALAELKDKVYAEGYVIKEQGILDAKTYYWTDDDEAGEDFDNFHDCVVDAFQHLMFKAKNG